jgi:hypothetical protein
MSAQTETKIQEKEVCEKHNNILIDEKKFSWYNIIV